MTAPSREVVLRILELALEAPASERGALLERECKGDAALRAKVEALLEFEAEAAGLFSPTVDEASRAEAAVEPSQEEAGASIGRYTLLQQIGQGGMGTIWMAEQREPVKRRVALKIIKLGMETKQVIARFEAERQALAMMDHPHIAKVLDAGATETGRPYFVMEYIQGIPILEYCDDERLDTRARLALFTNVCHAIQHAHQKGIIHRDIKPSNVLVTMHDGVAVPKVIDFGIAKATNSELATRTFFTEHRQMIGTPAYMSPEQAELSDLDIDTRSDVYSLGVLLYELLTGTTPIDTKKLVEGGLYEILRAIREDEPHKPSTRISSLGDTGTRTAEQRRVELKKLSLLLRGDLDWIVMKCLEKDRTRRYDTATGLADDIQRHLRDEPVTAGPPTAGYKLRKFAKRNRVQVFAAGAVTAALLIGVVAFAWQANAARDQRDLAVLAQRSEAEQRKQADLARADAEAQQKKALEQEAEARMQSVIAEAVAKFQTDMLAAADPQMLLGDKVTVLQVMEAAVLELERGSLADQPVVEARVRDMIGSTLANLARYDAAEPVLRKSLELRRAAFPPGHVQIAVGLADLATLLRSENKIDEAEPLLREALKIARAAYPAGSRELVRFLNDLAAFLREKNELAEAEQLLREALEIARAAGPSGHAEASMTLNNLAFLLSDQRKLDEAEPLLREALEIDRKNLPAGHPNLAAGMINLATVLYDQNEIDEAEPLFRKALEISRAAFPAGHPQISSALNSLAYFLYTQNRLAEAEPLCREALEIYRAARPAGHPDIAFGLDSLAMVLELENEIAEAEPLAREALEIRRKAHPAGHPEIAASLNSLAMLLQEENKLDESETLFREALEIRRKALPAGHPEIGNSANNLATVLQSQKKLDEAEPLFREALEIWSAANPPGHPTIATGMNNLAGLLQAQKKYAEAEPLAREALEIRRAALPAGHPDTSHSLFTLASILKDEGKLAEAEPFAREALEIDRAALPAGHPNVISSVRALAEIYVSLGKIKQAAPLMKELLEADRATLKQNDMVLAGRLTELGSMLVLLGSWSEAEPLLREALTIREAKDPDDWRTFNSKSLLGEAFLGQKKLDEAEPLLLVGFRGLQVREARIPPQSAARIPEALERIVKLYEARGDASETAAWRSKLAAARATAPKSGTGGGEQ